MIVCWKDPRVLKAKVKHSSNEEMGYDDLITDITELFLSGEENFRNPESVGSSPKSLTTLFWNLGNWGRGQFPSTRRTGLSETILQGDETRTISRSCS